MTIDTKERGTLPLGQPHPAAESALAWIRTQPLPTLLQWQEAFASTALEGNFAAEVCGETLRRLLEGEPVSDRYLLGLVWVMREGQMLMFPRYNKFPQYLWLTNVPFPVPEEMRKYFRKLRWIVSRAHDYRGSCLEDLVCTRCGAARSPTRCFPHIEAETSGFRAEWEEGPV